MSVFKLARVAKTDVIWPFYVMHHITVHPHALVAFIRTKTPKKIITPRLFLLCITIENKLDCHTDWWPNFQFACHWTQQPKHFGHQLSVNQCLNFSICPKNIGSYPKNLIVRSTMAIDPMTKKTSLQKKNQLPIFGCQINN